VIHTNGARATSAGRATARPQSSEAAVPPPLTARERDLDEIEAIAHVGSWTLDPRTGQAVWSTEMYRIFGLDPASRAVALPDISSLFVAESVERVGAVVARAIATGAPWHEELELLRPGGGTVVSNGVAERDDTGTTTRIYGTMQDITGQRELEALLRQSQGLEAVGQLAGGIAHDFNNLLTAIRGYADLARTAIDDGHPAASDLDHVIAASDRATNLVAQLLAFSRRQVLQPRVIDPAAAVEDVVPLLGRLLGEDIELSTVAEPGVGRIQVDPGQLGQVIVNLGVNARDAMPHGGRLVIETMNVELDEDYAALHPEVNPGGYVLIAVSDTGDGMDAATQARAFEPFFTTKPSGKGTGMGLATVYGIIKQSGGSIYLYSEQGRGTTFKLYFPRIDAEADRAASAAMTTPLALTGTETILLAEDDDDVRGYARRILRQAGYTVLEASRGSVALELAEQQQAPIQLLLTDAVLPGIHGAELAAQLCAIRPDLRVLYVSGFTENSVIVHGVVASGVSFLPKPYRAEDLLRNVREALDAPVARPS
jgi:signal transduction histidine kinase/ActR/RegA family two-component response regulator